MKIFFANCGYLTGLSGLPSDYALLFWRYVFSETPVSQVLIDTIKHEDPDVCLLVEMKKKSIDELSLIMTDYPHVLCVEKYGRGIFHKLTKKNVHVIFSKKPFDSVEKLLFTFGNKKSVLQASVNGITILLCHLSLLRKMRQKQIEELAIFMDGRTKTLLAGDFNVFKGKDEVQPLLHSGALYTMNHNDSPTFPAVRPTSELDYIFATKDIKEDSFEVLPELFSDHRALYCTIEE